MQWFMQFLGSPRGTLARLAGVLGIVLVLFIALAHSPRGLAPVIVGIAVTCGLLRVMRMPGRYIMRIAVGEFLILGLASLITQLADSGVFALLALATSVLVVVAVTRRVRSSMSRRDPVPWSRRRGLRLWWLPRRGRRYS